MFIQMVKNLFFSFLIFFSINSYCLVLTEYENFYETDGANVIETLKKIDEKFFRPAEVETLLADPKNSEKKLGWKPKMSFTKGIENTFDWYSKNKTYYSLLKKKIL